MGPIGLILPALTFGVLLAPQPGAHQQPTSLRGRREVLLQSGSRRSDWLQGVPDHPPAEPLVLTQGGEAEAQALERARRAESEVQLLRAEEGVLRSELRSERAAHAHTFASRELPPAIWATGTSG